MINFSEEIQKYDYILTVDDVAKKVEEEYGKKDVIELLEYITDKLDNTNSKSTYKSEE